MAKNTEAGLLELGHVLQDRLVVVQLLVGLGELQGLEGVGREERVEQVLWGLRHLY